MFNFRKPIAWLLLLLSLQWVVPREIWHSCASHTDTVDHDVLDGRLAIGTQHEHCTVLDLSLPPFDKVSGECSIALAVKPIRFSVSEALCTLQSAPRIFRGRAPPVLA